MVYHERAATRRAASSNPSAVLTVSFFARNIRMSQQATIVLVHSFWGKPQASTFGDTDSDPAWKHKPSCYQISTADRMI